MNSRPAISGRVGLMAAMAVIVAGWMVVLPAIAARPNMSAWLRQMDQQGIDASAMFYTELELMPELLDRLEGK